MTQLNIFANDRSDSNPTPKRDFWIAGIAILGVVFVPTAIAALLSLLSH